MDEPRTSESADPQRNLAVVASVGLAIVAVVVLIGVLARDASMLTLGLTVLGTGLLAGLRSLMGRLTEPGEIPLGTDFASEQEHLWAATGWRLAVGICSIGVVLVLLGLIF